MIFSCVTQSLPFSCDPSHSALTNVTTAGSSACSLLARDAGMHTLCAARRSKAKESRRLSGKEVK